MSLQQPNTIPELALVTKIDNIMIAECMDKQAANLLDSTKLLKQVAEKLVKLETAIRQINRDIERHEELLEYLDKELN